VSARPSYSGLAQPASLLRYQVPVHDLREDEDRLGHVRGVLQRLLAGGPYPATMIGFGEPRRRLRVVPLEYSSCGFLFKDYRVHSRRKDGA
jgi:hypothetical protein